MLDTSTLSAQARAWLDRRPPEKAPDREAGPAGACRRCHRPLTDPVSQRIGLGPVCRTLNPAGPAQTDDICDHFITDPPLAEKLVLRRIGNEVWTNVPHYAVKHSPAGFEWGYGGSGPADLALNLAEAIIRIARLDGGRPSACYIGEVSGMAWDTHQALKFGLISQIDQQAGAEIPFDALLADFRTMIAEYDGTGMDALYFVPAACVPYLPGFADRVAAYEASFTWDGEA